MDQTQGFLEAVKEGSLQKVTEMLAADPQLLNARDENGVSAVVWSCYRGQKAISDYLLSRGVKLDFFEAATVGKNDFIEQCIRKDPGLVTAFSKDGFTALGLASFFGHVETVRSLLEAGADPNVPSKNKMQVTPLHSAVANRDSATALAMTRLLLDHKAKVNVAQEGGWTPLHQAAAHGQIDVLRLLLEKGADTRAKSTDGRLPVDMATQGGHQKAVELLKAASGKDA